MGQIFQVRNTPLIPIEETVRYDLSFTTAQVGTITTGTTKKLALRTLRNVRLIDVEVQFKDFKHDAGTAVTVNLYAKLGRPSTLGTQNVALSAAVASATTFAANSTLRLFPSQPGHYATGGASGLYTATAGFGIENPVATTSGTTALTEANLTPVQIPDALSPLTRRYDVIELGLEISGGPVTTTLDLDFELSFVGLFSGGDTAVVPGKQGHGHTTFPSSVSTVSSSGSTTGYWDITSLPTADATYGTPPFDI